MCLVASGDYKSNSKERSRKCTLPAASCEYVNMLCDGPAWSGPPPHSGSEPRALFSLPGVGEALPFLVLDVTRKCSVGPRCLRGPHNPRSMLTRTTQHSVPISDACLCLACLHHRPPFDSLSSSCHLCNCRDPALAVAKEADGD